MHIGNVLVLLEGASWAPALRQYCEERNLQLADTGDHEANEILYVAAHRGKDIANELNKFPWVANATFSEAPAASDC